MNIREYNGKIKEELLSNALNELELTENEVLFNITSEKTGLLKKETFTLKLVTITDVLEFLKGKVLLITKDMGLNVTLETKIRENQITIKMYSDNNKILIGRNGQTLQALSTVLKQMVYNEINAYPYIILDVENYKEKQEQQLIRLAKKLAKEVKESKQEVELENMNSYSRRIIHNALTDFKGIYTESVGVEPNRHIVIKPKED